MENKKTYISVSIQITNVYADVLQASYQDEGVGDVFDFSMWE